MTGYIILYKRYISICLPRKDLFDDNISLKQTHLKFYANVFHEFYIIFRPHKISIFYVFKLNVFFL